MSILSDRAATPIEARSSTVAVRRLRGRQRRGRLAGVVAGIDSEPSDSIPPIADLLLFTLALAWIHEG
jgi:hypothetical protein